MLFIVKVWKRCLKNISIYVIKHTDSYIYDIRTDDVQNYMKSMIDKFDKSDYAKDDIYNVSQVKKKIVGKLNVY